jgi:RNA polymerase sigma factor (sigma-70 family)
MKLTQKDEEVIRYYLDSRDNNWLGILYKRYAKKVYRRCLTYTRDSMLAEDFTHDIFIRVFTKLDQFQSRSSFSSWLYTIAQNYCNDQHRHTNRLPLSSLEELDYEQIGGMDDTEVVDLTTHQLAYVVNTVPPDRLALLHLKYVEGLDSREIARRYNLNDSTVKMRLKRTRDLIVSTYQQRID